MPDYQFSHLDQLEAEAIFVLRETAAQFENPALLFSGGKDSIVMAWLARKAFWPARMPFPLVHIDTGHNFPETMALPESPEFPAYRGKPAEIVRVGGSEEYLFVWHPPRVRRHPLRLPLWWIRESRIP